MTLATEEQAEARRESTDAAAGTVESPLGSYPVAQGECLLDAALAAGVQLPHGCRVGACGACAVEVLSGRETCSPPDAIERDALRRYHFPPEVRLACRATCRGHVRLRPA